MKIHTGWRIKGGPINGWIIAGPAPSLRGVARYYVSGPNKERGTVKRDDLLRAYADKEIAFTL